MEKSSGKLEAKLNEFSAKQIDKILENTFAIQLTEGCSTGCTDCGAGATKGVTDYIPFKLLEEIFSNHNLASKKQGEVIPYFASDPFDYSFEGKNFLDVHKLYWEKKGKNLCVITSIPKGSEELVLNTLVRDSGKIGGRIIDGVSLTKFNYLRIEKSFEELPEVKKQKKNPFGYYVINFSSKHKIKSREKIDFKGFLEIVDSGNHPFFTEGIIRNYYSGNRERYALGESNKKNLGSTIISPYQGVILTPSGISNVELTKPTFENPIGQIITPVDSKEFFVESFYEQIRQGF